MLFRSDSGILITTSMDLSTSPSDTVVPATRSSPVTGTAMELMVSPSSDHPQDSGILITTSTDLSTSPSDTEVSVTGSSLDNGCNTV